MRGLIACASRPPAVSAPAHYTSSPFTPLAAWPRCAVAGVIVQSRGIKSKPGRCALMETYHIEALGQCLGWTGQFAGGGPLSALALSKGRDANPIPQGRYVHQSAEKGATKHTGTTLRKKWVGAIKPRLSIFTANHHECLSQFGGKLPSGAQRADVIRALKVAAWRDTSKGQDARDYKAACQAAKAANAPPPKAPDNVRLPAEFGAWLLLAELGADVPMLRRSPPGGGAGRRAVAVAEAAAHKKLANKRKRESKARKQAVAMTK